MVAQQLIAIVGPTASGKTALALDIAERIGGEIICADSRTLYRGMDIGTAKPTAEEQARVRHHVIDILEPGDRLGAREFARLVGEAEADIRSRGQVPMLVGGSGLYVDAVLFAYEFPGGADPQLRAELEALTHEEMVQRLEHLDPQAAQRVDLANPRRVMRAIETMGQERSRRATIREDAIAIGCMMNKEIAQFRIEKRIDFMLAYGFLEELERLARRYGADNELWNVIGYRAMKDVIFGGKSLEDGRQDFVRGDMALYKKQVTWFKRNPEIHWLREPTFAAARETLGIL